MKKFLHTILRFSLLPVALLLLLEIIIGTGRHKLLSEQKLEKVFLHSGDSYQWISAIHHPAKILLLGSSTVKYGLSCQKLNELSHDSLSFVNLAANARDPVESYFILKQLDLSGVTAVYMGIDPWIYTKAYYKSRDPYMYLDMDFITAARYGISQDPKAFARRYKAFFRSLIPASPVKKNAAQPVPADLGSGVLTRPPINFNDSVQNKFKLKQYGWSDLQFKYLQKIGTFCESRHIAFYVFYPPKRSDFIADYRKYCRDIHAAFLGKLKEHGFHSPILGSFEQLQPGGDSLFVDAYHLSAGGQAVYSAAFYKMITNNK